MLTNQMGKKTMQPDAYLTSTFSVILLIKMIFVRERNGNLLG